MTGKEKTGERIAVPILLGAAVFLCMVLFYTKIHPLYIYDTDDWNYISYARIPLPGGSDWNPTRILPETLMPLTASFGAWLIMPFTHDYIGSMCTAFAIVIAMLEAVYFVGMYLVMKNVLNGKKTVAVLVTAGLFLLHFSPMGNAERKSYMLYGGSVTCYFYYTVPALLNAVLVMLAIRKGDTLLSAKDNKIYAGVVLLLVYLAVNSNLFQSIILPAYGGAVILTEVVKFFKNRKTGRKFSDVRKKNAVWVFIIMAWLGSCLLEANGGRAKSFATDGSYIEGLKKTLNYFVNTAKSFDKLWVISVTLLILSAVAVYVFHCIKKEADEDDRSFADQAIKLLVCTAVVILYLILLCTKVASGYITSMYVQIVWMFYAVLLAGVCGSYVLKKLQTLQYIVPLTIFFLAFTVVIDGNAYANNATHLAEYIDAKTIKALDEDIVEQVVKAYEKGETDVEVVVPQFDSSDNWPIANYGGNSISNTLYQHGIIDRKMNITLVPSQEINDKYGI